MRLAAILAVSATLALGPAPAWAGIAGVGAANGGARGLAANPASAVGSGGYEISIDVTGTVALLHYTRASYDGTDPSNDPDRTFRKSNTLQHGFSPSFAFRLDALRPSEAVRRAGPRRSSSPLGIGLSLSFPTGTNIDLKPEGPGRYHMINASSLTGYLTPAVAWRPHPRLRIGAGPVLAISRLSFKKRIDLAPSLQELTGGDPRYTPESALLEGQIEVNGAQGYSASWTAGVLYEAGDRALLGIGFIAPSRTTMRGTSVVTPSLDFDVHSKGRFALSQNLPPILNVGARYRMRETLMFTGEAQWIGWSRARTSHLTITGSTLYSESGETQLLLDTLGINEGQLIEGILDKDQPSPRGYRDGWNLVVGTELGNGSLRWRAETGFFRATVPDGYVNPSNLDFDNVMIGAGAIWNPRAVKGLVLGLNIYEYVNGGRKITNSHYRTYDAPRGAVYALPSGNGTYRLLVTRAVLTTSWRF